MPTGVSIHPSRFDPATNRSFFLAARKVTSTASRSGYFWSFGQEKRAGS
jgi:hypothetical protein